MMSGQLMVRDSGETHKGRKIFMVFGIVAFPDEMEIKSEHQYTLAQLKLTDGQDMTEIMRGNTPDGLLCDEHWRV